MSDLIDPTPELVHGRGPDWTCVADGQPWPCDSARAALVRLYRGRMRELRTLMRYLRDRARGDLILPVAEINDRFLRWLPRPRAARRSMGGPST